MFGAAEMQKDAEGADSDAAGDRLVAGAIDVARPDDDVRDAELLAVLGDELVLLHLREAIRVAAQLGMRLDRARLVAAARLPARLASPGVDREGTDVDEPPQAAVPPGGVEEVAGRDDRVHERVRKGLLAPAAAR